MAIRILSETDARITSRSASVCVVGAGVAGLIAATRLARDKTRRVVVLESGLKKLDPAWDALNEIEHPARLYQKALTRFRGLGGNSHLWDGKLLPLSPHDTKARPYVDIPAWPFDLAELDPYREEIESILGVDKDPYEEDASPLLDPQSLLPRNAAGASVRWAKRPSLKNQNLAHVFREEIAALENLEIWLGATAAHFDFESSTGKITALKAINQAGQTLTVVADEYLIAAGTLESTRLLLLADQQGNETISRGCTALGHYFNDHLGLDAAIIRPVDRTLTNKMLSDRRNAGRHLHVELKGDVQERNGIASAYADFGALLPDHSSLTKSKQVLHSLTRGKVDFTFRDIQAIITDSPSIFWMTQWQCMRQQKYWPANATIQMKIWAEQAPHWKNRISLSDRKDALRLPVLKLDWDKTEAEEKTFRAAITEIDRYWQQYLAPICRLEWTSAATAPGTRLVDASRDLAHPAGSTRMGVTPADSVVDAHLKVHRIPNLSVASASVFPSSGSANPTLTIMQLALRAADAIIQRLPRE